MLVRNEGMRRKTKDGFVVEDEVKFEVVGGASRREQEGEHFLSHTHNVRLH